MISIVFGLRHLRAGQSLPATRPGRLGGAFWGAAAGFTRMISHAGGVPFQIYVMLQKLTRDSFVGTFVLFFAIVNWMKIPPFLALGQVTAANLITSLALFPLAIASTWAGVRLVRHVSGERLYSIVYALLVVLGIGLVLGAVADLL